MDTMIVGLGYVGTVSAACLASAGNTVWGVDINADKVRAINITGRADKRSKHAIWIEGGLHR